MVRMDNSNSHPPRLCRRSVKLLRILSPHAELSNTSNTFAAAATAAPVAALSSPSPPPPPPPVTSRRGSHPWSWTPKMPSSSTPAAPPSKGRWWRIDDGDVGVNAPSMPPPPHRLAVSIDLPRFVGLLGDDGRDSARLRSWCAVEATPVSMLVVV